MPDPPSPRILPDPEAVARAAAGRVVALAAGAIAARGRFRLAVPGGRTPARLFALLAGEFAARFDAPRLELLFADERAVPPEDPASNYRLARESLIDPLRIPQGSVRRMRGEADDLDAEADRYEAFVAEPLDLLVLGIGEDGHVASLFPSSPLIAERRRRVAAVGDAPKPPPRRLTLTARAIAEARAVLVLATGADKSRAAARALAPGGDPAECPARLVRDREWLLDREAATLLHDS